MRTVKIKELNLESFKPFGTFANLINPKSEKLGAPPIEFYRDMIQQDMGREGLPSFSVCRVEKRDLIIDVTEYHSKTAEGILPLDNDILIHVAAATRQDGSVPFDKIEVFRVPKGTMVVIRPGVWHHAPLVMNNNPANVLIVLPERTYANDCEVFKFENEEKIKIEI